MKLHTEQKEVIRGGVVTESQFSIKATAKAFGILSSGLYSDKIGAIVRELSCNAYDAHVAAGRKDKPILVKLPTTLDPTFYVKDFGIGLDHKGVTELYTTYFESSKSDSNDYIGALGLGSKSPFSYVSTFSVEARYNGVKRMYSAFINEEGVPSISKLGEEKTVEDNGLTVSLAAKRDDAAKFAAAAMKAFMYFDTQPAVTGGGPNFKPYSVKHTVSGTNWKFRETDYYAHMEGSYVVQGMVAYPIDKEILAQHGLSTLGQNILRQNIDLFVKIGDVEVAASREALSYTKKTIENLIRIVDTAAKEMRVSVQKEFDKQPSMWDARGLHVTYDAYGHKMHNLYSELSRAKPFTYKGQKIEDEAKLNLTGITLTALGVYHMSSYSSRRSSVNKVHSGGAWDPSNATKSFSFTMRPGMKVVVDDAQGGKALLAMYLADQKNVAKDGNDTYVLVVKGLSKNVYDAKEVDKIIDMLGATNAVYTKTLSYTVQKTKYAYKARKSDEAVSWIGFPQNGGYKRDQLRRVFSRLCWNGVKVDLHNESGFYVPLDRFAIMHNKHEQTNFDVFLSSMASMGILDKKVSVYGLNEKQVNMIKRNAKWKNIFTYAAEQFAVLNAKNALTNKMVADKVMTHIGESVRRSIVNEWNTIEPKLIDGAFKDLFDNIYDYQRAGVTCKLLSQNIEGAAHYVDDGDKFLKGVNDEFGSFVTKFSSVMGKHAMLGLVDWTRVSAKNVDMIIGYVNFVAKS